MKIIEPDAVFTTLLLTGDVIPPDVCQHLLNKLTSLLPSDNTHVSHKRIYVCTEGCRSPLAD